MGSFRPSGDFTREKYSLLNSGASNQASFLKKRTKDSKKKRKEDKWRRRAEKGGEGQNNEQTGRH